MLETDWFPYEIKPVHEGVYRTRHFLHGGECVAGFSRWWQGRWSYVHPSAVLASRLKLPGSMQRKEWKGLLREDVAVHGDAAETTGRVSHNVRGNEGRAIEAYEGGC